MSSKNGCFKASSADILFSGSNCKNFFIKSIPSVSKLGNNCLKSFSGYISILAFSPTPHSGKSLNPGA